MGSSFYLIDESAADYPHADTSPLSFDTALAQAEALVQRGHAVRVLYSEDATPAEIQRLTEQGIPAELASTA